MTIDRAQLERLAESVLSLHGDPWHEYGAKVRLWDALDPATVLALLDVLVGAEAQVAALTAEMDRFYDFVNNADAAIVDAYLFTENNTPEAIERRLAALSAPVQEETA